MSDAFTEIDRVLLSRWPDVVALSEALQDLQERLGRRLESAAESIRPWLDEQGFGFLEVEDKYAAVNIARTSWLNKKTEQPWVWFTLDAILPYGYRKVEEEHPYVWVDVRNLEKEQRGAFQEELNRRIQGRPGGWLNEHCTRDQPAGRFIASHTDRERLTLLESKEAMAEFMREQLASIFPLADDVEASLLAARGK